MPRKKQVKAVTKQTGFEDAELADLPGVTEETVADVSRQARRYLDASAKLAVAEIREAIKSRNAAKRAVFSVLPDNVDRPTRVRIGDVAVVELTPIEREPYEVEGKRITRRQIKHADQAPR